MSVRIRLSLLPAFPQVKVVVYTNGLRLVYTIFDEVDDWVRTAMCENCRVLKNEEKNMSKNYDQLLTLSANGLTKFIEDLVSLQPQTKTVVDRNDFDEYGDYKRKTVPVPKEELWTLVAIQTAEGGKFRVQVRNSDLDKISTNKDRTDATKAYEAL